MSEAAGPYVVSQQSGAYSALPEFLDSQHQVHNKADAEAYLARVHEIGRVMRPMEGIYDMSVDRPPPLVPRRRCLEAIERIGPRGEIIVPLDVASVERAAESFARQEVEAVAICFLFSFLNPDHERRAAEILARRLQGVAISQSHRISPEYREYERASTAVINAYLSPVMTDYLDRLKARIANLFGDARLFL